MNKKDPTIEIKIATSSDLTDEDLEIFATELTQINFEKPDIAFQEMRMKFREWLERTKIMVKKTYPCPPKYSPDLDNIHPTPTLKTTKEGQTEYFREKIKDGSTIILKIDGEPAGIAHIRKEGVTDDQRIVYAIGGLVIKPEYRNKGYSKALLKERYEALRKNHPANPIIVQSRNPKVIKYYEKLGWKQISIREKLKFYENEDGYIKPEKEIQARESKHEKYGWKILMYDPQNQT